MSVGILVPVLSRPRNVQPLLDSIEAATPEPHAVHFICTPQDHEEIAAIKSDGRASYRLAGGGYAQKINSAVRETTEPLLFLGADDLRFHAGWLPAARARLGGGIEVVGVNDLCSERVQSGKHATHFLMTREYALRPTIDGARGPVHQGYKHWFCDDELVATAKARGVIAFAPDSVVEHLHPMAGKAPDDNTYQLGRAKARLDRKLYRKRERLWR